MMKRPQPEPAAPSHRSHPGSEPFQRDADGRLFDPEMRRYAKGLGQDPAAIEALGALRFASKLMHLGMRRYAEQHGLTEGRLAILMRLRHSGEMPLGELAEQLEVSPRNVTGLIDNLERDGLVERVPDAADRRSVRARLTGAGCERIESIWKEAMERQVHLVDHLGKDELAQLRHTCLSLVETIRKEIGR